MRNVTGWGLRQGRDETARGYGRLRPVEFSWEELAGVVGFAGLGARFPRSCDRGKPVGALEADREGLWG